MVLPGFSATCLGGDQGVYEGKRPVKIKAGCEGDAGSGTQERALNDGPEVFHRIIFEPCVYHLRYAQDLVAFRMGRYQ